MLFFDRRPRKDRIAGRFVAQVHAAIANAAVAAKRDEKLTQRKVADELGVDKSVISRILSGRGNPTARTIGELAAALGYRPELVLHRIGDTTTRNHYVVTQGVPAQETFSLATSPTSAATSPPSPNPAASRQISV